MNDKTFKNMQEGRERAIRTARLLCRVAPVPFAEHYFSNDWGLYVIYINTHHVHSSILVILVGVRREVELIDQFDRSTNLIKPDFLCIWNVIIFKLTK